MIPRTQLPTITAKIKDWAYLNGLVMRNSSLDGVIHAPIAVLPCPFPKSSFDNAVDIMPLMNDLYHAVSCDYDFLVNTLTPTVKFDDFTAKLLDIYIEVYEKQNGMQKLELGIHRSDYMLDEPSGRLLQVELNTIASSFGCLSTQVSGMHSFVLSHIDQMDRSRIAENHALKDIAAVLARAHELVKVPNSQILVVVDHDDQNRYDQEFVAMRLWEHHKVKMLRKPLSEIINCSSLTSNGDLLVDEQAISVVYYRSGYSPTSYPTELEWQARRMIELSSACKCPSISYHLTGTKKIQQELAKAGSVEKYLSEEASQRVREFFAGLWGFDDLEDPTTVNIIKEAISNPDAFVLKPQREGGGNNIYGQDVADKLSKQQGLAAFVLMQRIQPPVHKTPLLRNEELLEAETVSELGIYGTYLKKGEDCIVNKASGHLLRTKVSTSNEGGVASGFAVLDSPYLTED